MAVGGPGFEIVPEMIQNGTKINDLKHLGSLGPERVQNGAKTDHFLNRVLEGGSIVINKIMNEINSKASKVTGRVNNNMILLKVI